MIVKIYRVGHDEVWFEVVVNKREGSLGLIRGYVDENVREFERKGIKLDALALQMVWSPGVDRVFVSKLLQTILEGPSAVIIGALQHAPPPLLPASGANGMGPALAPGPGPALPYDPLRGFGPPGYSPRPPLYNPPHPPPHSPPAPGPGYGAYNHSPRPPPYNPPPHPPPAPGLLGFFPPLPRAPPPNW